MGIRRREVASSRDRNRCLPQPPSSPRSVPARAQSKTESTWDLIKRTGKGAHGHLRLSAPTSLRDKASGEWVGAMVEMAKDIAKELDVKLEMVEGRRFRRGRAQPAVQQGRT